MQQQINGNNGKPVELYGEEVQEILGRVPGWIVARGTAIMAGVLVLFVVAAFLFRYPDTIAAELVLSGQNPPVRLVSKVNGRIFRIFVNDRQWVEKNTPLVLLESAADFEHIQITDNILKSGLKNIVDTIDDRLTGSFELGEAQGPFSAFQHELTVYRRFIEQGYYQQMINWVVQENEKNTRLIRGLETRRLSLLRDTELAVRQYRRDSMLHKRQLMADMQLENSEGEWMRKLSVLSETEAQIASAQTRGVQLQRQLSDLQLSYEKESEQRWSQLQEQYDKARSTIDIWRQRYILEAPVSGGVSFSAYWSEQQQVSAGETVLTLIPAGQGLVTGRAKLPMDGAGKVKPGQLVNIRLDRYPFLEFGLLRGEVKSITEVPEGGGYVAEITLTNGLVTNYGFQTGFAAEMTGRAEIITENMSLMRRMINPVKFTLRRYR